MKSKRILCVGLVCVDVVQVCTSFPIEDTDQRCIEQHWQRGGNASNNCTVLSHLGADCEFFGTVSGGLFCGYVTNDFEIHKIIVDNCVYHDGCDFPLSMIIINSENGSRTIIHSNKNLPELTVEDFKKLDLSCYSWIHFEGRNIQQVKLMMEYATSWRLQNNGNFKISVEMEKPQSELQILAALTDVLFIGKDYAQFKGYTSMEDAIQKIKPTTKPGTIIISAQGELGATGFSDEEGFVSSPANIQPKTVDTLGAGDTFFASVIFSLNEGHSVKNSVWFGCKIAGLKVGMSGYTLLKQVSDPYLRELKSKLLTVKD